MKRPATFSQLKQWGIKGPVQVIDTRYTYDSRKWSMDRLDSPTDYDRRTLTYYNQKGNMDSVIEFLKEGSSEVLNSRYLFETKGDFIYGTFYLKGERISTSIMYGIPTNKYVLVLQNKAGVTTKYVQSLNAEGRATVLEINRYGDAGWEKEGMEENFFSKENRLDSIVSIFGSTRTRIANKDYQFDELENPTKSVKQRDNEPAYLIDRKYIYFTK